MADPKDTKAAADKQQHDPAIPQEKYVSGDEPDNAEEDEAADDTAKQDEKQPQSGTKQPEPKP